MMEIDTIVTTLTQNATRIHGLASGASDKQARWKPDAESWSILEVVNHLLEEETADFRTRLDYILHRPGEPWPPIDPVGWVTAHRYNERDLADSLGKFMAARQESIVWLQALGTPDWERAEQAPWGPFRAGDMMAAWLAHDLLHLRQLVELHYAFLTQQVEPYSVRYAGEW